jgi:hypothetical protein
MKLSQLLTRLKEDNFVTDGETDYERVRAFMLKNEVKPVNRQVWKLVNALQEGYEEAEEDL